MKKFWEKFRSIFFYIIVFILISYILLQAIAPRATVKVFGFKPFVVVTQSMEPVINVNDVVFIKNFDINDLENEDIITFLADVNYDGEKEIVTHYIYSITEDTSGELIIRTHRYFENEEDYIPDNWFLTEDDILGQYMFHIPKIGAVIQFLKSPFGIGAMVFNIGIIITIIYLIKKEKNQQINQDK